MANKHLVPKLKILKERHTNLEADLTSPAIEESSVTTNSASTDYETQSKVLKAKKTRKLVGFYAASGVVTTFLGMLGGYAIWRNNDAKEKAKADLGQTDPNNSQPVIGGGPAPRTNSASSTNNNASKITNNAIETSSGNISTSPILQGSETIAEGNTSVSTNSNSASTSTSKASTSAVSSKSTSGQAVSTTSAVSSKPTQVVTRSGSGDLMFSAIVLTALIFSLIFLLTKKFKTSLKVK
jgi:hypothetical protein